MCLVKCTRVKTLKRNANKAASIRKAGNDPVSCAAGMHCYSTCPDLDWGKRGLLLPLVMLVQSQINLARQYCEIITWSLTGAVDAVLRFQKPALKKQVRKTLVAHSWKKCTGTRKTNFLSCIHCHFPSETAVFTMKSSDTFIMFCDL